MKKHFKLFCAFLLITTLMLTSGCVSLSFAFLAPGNFPGTTWTAENNGVKISFTVDEEAVIRFEGQWEMEEGVYIDVSPVYSDMFGCVSTASGEYEFFAQEFDHTLWMTSEELPPTPEEGEDYISSLEKYELLFFSIIYKGPKCFVATVESSIIDEIPEGTVFEFHRSDAK